MHTQTPLSYLQKIYGYSSFRKHQEEIIQRVIDGEHTLLVMPTGGGKSLCYQLPSLIRNGVGLVISPLIALMQDQVNSLNQLGVQAAFLNSSLSIQEQRIVEQQAKVGELDLLYVAPERLMRGSFKRILAELKLALIAVDEAHCISQWGHDFRPEYMQLAEIRNVYDKVPWIAVTATADTPTQKEIINQLQIPIEGLLVSGFDRPNLNYTVALKNNPKKQLLRFIQEEHAGESGIVYRFSRKKVEDTTIWLNRQGIDALPYHAGLSTTQRAKNQERFLKEEGLIVVATIAFGMGIDKPNVRFVAHLDVPKSLEAYYQETGRAGRDGLPADAWMAYSLADIVAMRKLLETSEAKEQQRWLEHHKLNQLFGYCESISCRRQVLLNYFGQQYNEACGKCDTCLHPVEQWNGTVAAQKVLSCIARTGQRFGAGHIIDVLLGKESDKIRRFGHDQLSTFGIGTENSAHDWRSIIRQLVANAIIKVDVTGFGSLQLTPDCKPILKGQTQIFFRKDHKVTRQQQKKGSTSHTASLQLPEDRRLFESLRALRLEIARDQGVPPYIVFGDATLLAMVEHKPLDLQSFSQLSGVGEVKLKRYGIQFLEVLQSHS